MHFKILTIALFYLASINYSLSTKPNTVIHSGIHSKMDIEFIYANLQTNHFELPQIKSFTQALNGFYKLKEKGLIKKILLQ